MSDYPDCLRCGRPISVLTSHRNDGVCTRCYDWLLKLVPTDKIEGELQNQELMKRGYVK